MKTNSSNQIDDLLNCHDIYGCSACGYDHVGIEFLVPHDEDRDEADFYFVCPVNGEFVFARYDTKEPTE